MATFMQRAKSALTMLFRPTPPAADAATYFWTLDGYAPVFTTYEGGLYEAELCRESIHTFANHVSKLSPTVEGADLRKLSRILDLQVNPFMTGAQFLYKTATIYEAQNTCFIVPVLDALDRITGYYPVNPQLVELVDVHGEPWIRYTFMNAETAALPLKQCGIVSKFLYSRDLFGEDNAALLPTLQLIRTQTEGIEAGIKNSAAFRFMAVKDNFSSGKDLAKERKEFVENNMAPDSGGLIVFPNTFKSIQQINSTAKIVDPDQMKIIEERVYTYFGTSRKILQNSAYGDEWSAYYEGKIEPFALQLSQAMTCMTFSPDELARGNRIFWSANRLQYMTNADKLNVSTQLQDRGVLSPNEVRDIWNLPHIPNGDEHVIRKDYGTLTEQVAPGSTPAPAEETTPEAAPAPVQEEEVEDGGV